MKKIREDNFQFSDRNEDINIDKLHQFLSEKAYWCRGIPKEIVEKSINNSLNFSILDPNNEFSGFARVVTDFATFAYLADVFILEDYRGKSLGKWLISEIMKHPELSQLRTWLLLTKDAQKLYEKYGWDYIEEQNKVMIIRGGSDFYTQNQIFHKMQ